MAICESPRPADKSRVLSYLGHLSKYEMRQVSVCLQYSFGFMHHVIAAGEGSDRAPDSCKLCPYYRPDFKFHTCLYAHCPYKKQVNVFRSTPEKWDITLL